LADGLKLLNLTIFIAICCIYLYKDVPTHFVIFSIQITLHLWRNFIDFEEIYETCCYTYGVCAINVWKLWNWDYFF